ncbi:MAG: sugar ABC transporter permease [Firmicutes bacterium]|nr:sugar ABC transporter permease [Bacillota bacterium]
MKSFKSFFTDFLRGSIILKLSYFVMGLYQIVHKQFVRGIIFLVLQIGFWVFMGFVGFGLIGDLITLGEYPFRLAPDLVTSIPGDNSFLMLLYGVLGLAVIFVFLFAYFHIVSLSRQFDKKKENENFVKANFKDDLKSLVNENFHFTMMIVPLIFLTVFLIVPLVFMILVAFTDFSQVMHPEDSEYIANQFFSWAGFRSFGELFALNPRIRQTFFGVLLWTLAWAVLATITNYILGILVAMLINSKGVKGRKLIRILLVISIAIPQFITLMVLRTFLDDHGVFNNILREVGIISENIRFISVEANPWVARATVIIANLWIGIPFTMLIATGILMNIPKELYEAARIDGAGPFRIFFKITMPFVLFITTPYLITQFIGNLNNFNVIFLLTGGNPGNLNYYHAGSTDLLITWLFRLTRDRSDFSIASVIGIMVFTLSAVFSLVFYRRSATYKREGEFA